MTVATDWQAGWQALVEAVGTDFAPDCVLEGADAIELGTIRRYVEPLELGCPLHHDREVARRHGYADVVAPCTSLMTFTIPPLWRPGEPPLFTDAARDAQPARTAIGPPSTGLEPPCTGYFATDIAIDWLRPAVVGDRLHRVGHKLLSCTPKATSVGRGAFMTWESQIRNQRDETVARTTTGTYTYEPHAEAGGRAPQPPLPASPPVFEPPPPADWERQRRWDEVEEGEELPPYAFPISVYRLVVVAGANRDFNSIHHNTEYARSTGAPEMYANNLFLQGMWERVVRQWIGLAGTIRALAGFRMTSFNTAGDVVVVRGRVARKWREGGDGLVELGMRSENSHGVSVGPGSMTVTLP